MNPELLNRIQAGSFVRLNLVGDLPVAGYIGSDPSQPGSLRLDGYFLGEEGSLREMSLHLAAEEIASVDFLPESPVFTDAEGQSVTMARGFMKHLD